MEDGLKIMECKEHVESQEDSVRLIFSGALDLTEVRESSVSL